MSLKNLKFLLQLIIFFIVVIYIYLNVNLSELINLIEYNERSKIILLLFLITTFLTNIFQTIRWKILIEHFAEKSFFFLYLKFITYSNLLSEVSFFGIFSRMMIKLYSEIKALNILISLFTEKIFSVYSLIFLCCVSLIFMIENNFFQLTIVNKEIFFACALFIILLPILLIRFKNLKIFDFIRNFNLIKKFIYFLNYKFFFLILLNSLIIQILAIVGICLVSQIFNFDIDLLTMFFIVPIINFFIAIPASISPWGWREFIFMNILPFVGLSNEQSLLISLTNGILLLVAQFIFYLFLIIFSRKMLNQ